jgi:hypothetical protein
VIQKIEHVSVEAIIDSRHRGHSPRPRGEYLPQQPLRLRCVPVWSLAFGSLDFPLIAIVGITEKGKKITCTQDRYKIKLERLRLARLTRRDQVVTL